MLYEELQGLVMLLRQLSQQILDFEQRPVELHADLGGCDAVWTEPLGFEFFHDDTLAFLGQTDEVVVVTEQDERLWKLERTKWNQQTFQQKSCLFLS